MAAIIPPIEVTDPSPQVPRYGLWNAANILDLPPHGRAGGITYRTVVTDLPDGFAVACATSEIKFEDPCGDQVTGTPFTVMANLATGTIGITEEEVHSALLQRLIAGEQPVVEQIFCDRLFGASPSLVSNVPPATALAATTNIMDGVGSLEAWLYARFGPRGVLHVPIALAARFQEKTIMSWDGATWRTALGTAIAFGNYSGKDNDGDAPAAGTTNIYITGTTTIWRTPDAQIEMPPFPGSINYRYNQITPFARREYVVTHNGLLACVNVTINGV